MTPGHFLRVALLLAHTSGLRPSSYVSFSVPDASQNHDELESPPDGIAEAKKALERAFAHDSTLKDAVHEQMETEDWEGVVDILLSRYGEAGEESLVELGTKWDESWFEVPRDAIVDFNNASGTGLNLSDWFESQEWQSFVSPIGKPGQRGVKDVNIFYITVRGEGTKGGVVYVPGSGESIRKMDEFAATLLRKGYSPIYIYAHRGQGESDRLIDSDRLYVEASRDLVHDLRAFTELIVGQRAASDEDKDMPLYMVCHSIGGSVCTTFLLEEYEAQRLSPYAAVALVAPAVKVETGSIPYWSAKALANLLHAIGRGQTDRPFGGTATFEQWHSVAAFKTDGTTHSFTRFKYNKLKCNMNREKRFGVDQHRGVCLFGHTVSWAKGAFDLDQDAIGMYMKTEGKELNVPILLQTAGTDQFVQNDQAEAFCERSTACSYSNFPGSRHDILQEIDEIRQRAFREIDDFFVANSDSVSDPITQDIPTGLKENGESCYRDLQCFSRNCAPRFAFAILGGTCAQKGTFLIDEPTPEPYRSPARAFAATAAAVVVLFGACFWLRGWGSDSGDS